MARSAMAMICEYTSSYFSVILILSLLVVAVRNGQRLHATILQWDFDENLNLPHPSSIENNKPSSSHNITLSRSQPILLTEAKFSYLHISKNSGVSWIRELKRLKQVPSGIPGHYLKMAQAFSKTGLYPIADSGAEHGAVFQDILLQDHQPFFRLVTLRSPRHQIWSMFSHCYYSDWGKRATSKDPHFPRGHDELVDFELWLNEFLDDTQEQPLNEEGMKQRNHTLTCYHPQNYQSRALVSTQREPRQPESGMIEPNLDQVLASYWSFDWVALTSFFHESKCLLYYRLDTKGASKKVHQLVSDYLKLTCHCHPSELNPQEMDINVAHSNQGKRPTLLDLPPSILQKMDILSRIDVYIYGEALDQFLREVVWLESQLQRRVLCDPVLEKLGQELSYLPLLQNTSLSLRYHEARRLTLVH